MASKRRSAGLLSLTITEVSSSKIILKINGISSAEVGPDTYLKVKLFLYRIKFKYTFLVYLW